MKLPQLLSQYLYQTKKLDLPGIGRFVLDPAAVIPEQSDKNIHVHATGISFTNVAIHTADDGLIQFIKEHTGKMKPLAAADLDFFLTTGKQLLNIGKPFYLEGIGTLMQTKEGQLSFTPGEYSSVKLEEPEKKEKQEKRMAYDEPRLEYEAKSNNAKQVVLLIAIIVVLGAIGWGGYYLYKRNTYVEPPVAEKPAHVVPDSASRPPADTTGKGLAQQGNPGASTTPAGTAGAAGTSANATAGRPDSLAARMPTPGPNQALYKFIILETEKKARALKRYNQLLGFQLNIKMEQKDSSYFKLYFPIAAAPRDTAYIKDSLTTTYAAHVRIEH